MTTASSVPAPALPVVRVHRGDAPLLLSLPHVGTALPDWLRPRLVDAAHAVPDTDWHLERLYDFAPALGVTVLVPAHSRYVVDLNRPPEDGPMYPGRNNTGLCPRHDFTGAPLYLPGQEPQAAEVAARVDAYWRPYHAALAQELARLRARHGHVVLFDGHSIRGELPWLFEGRLPDLNLGTAGGSACDASLQAALQAVLDGQTRFSHVTNGRFQGGHITRAHGRPGEGVHAVQMEMSWRCCMDEDGGFGWREDRAAEVRPVLRALFEALLAWRPRGAAR